MSAKTAAKPKVSVRVREADSPPPPHLEYKTAFLTASIGRQEDRKVVTWRCVRADGSKSKLYDHKDGVTVSLGEWDWQRSAVYLGIYSTYRAADGDRCDGSFEERVTPKQLDDMIELLIATRDKARELGILTPREVPKARSA